MSAQLVKLVQGSPEWHAHRAKYRNASETPAVMGVSPYTTAYQLWQHSTGRVTPQVTSAMAHGTATEPVARLMYETLTGNVMQPLVLVDGEYSASLDGITLRGDLIVEIKSPKSRDSLLLKEARSGRVPVHVYWQIQHQLMVSGARLGHLYVYDGKTGVLLEQAAEPDAWDLIRKGWDEFAEFIRTDTPPPLSERDTIIREDGAWVSAAGEYLTLKAAAEAACEALDAAKARLIGLTQHTSEKGAGVAVSRYWKAGNVDYKRVPELIGVDLEPYRAKGSEQIRINLSR